MNAKVKVLFLAVNKERVVCVSTNLTDFLRKMKVIEPTIKGNSHYEKKFKKQDLITFINIETGEKYNFQKIINSKTIKKP